MSLPLFAKISDKITMIHLSDSDSNIYLFGDSVIDTGTGLNFVRMMDVMKRIGKNLDGIKHIINTHAHFDHVGGNGFFEKAGISIHEKEADVLEKGDKDKALSDYFGGSFHPMEVSRKLKEGDAVDGLKVFHTPGHTEGSICLLEENSGTLFSGDTVFLEGVGRTDLPGGNEEDLVKSMEKILNLNPKIILPGHGEPIRKDPVKHIQALQEFADFR